MVDYGYRGQTTFKDSFEFGESAEKNIAGFLEYFGDPVTPVMDIVTNKNLPISKRLEGNGWHLSPSIGGSGPSMYNGGGDIIALSDFYVEGKKGPYWVDSKHKTSFARYNNANTITCGIDRKAFKDYIIVSIESQIPVYLMFVVGDGEVKEGMGGDERPPPGLYKASVSTLAKKIYSLKQYENKIKKGHFGQDRVMEAINEHSHKMGNNGMWVWPLKDFAWVCSLEDLNNINNVNTTSIK